MAASISILNMRGNAVQAARLAKVRDAMDELVEAAEEVCRLSDRNHVAWHRLKAALARVGGGV